MISRVDSSNPKSLGDLELKQADAHRGKNKTAKPAETEGATDDQDELVSGAPVHIRYLGKNLDLIA
ncbi:MAG: hypothetical protein AAB229_01045 [Candidatus Hydrogenedentota bacterium]